ncbi:MAG: DNA translocase FtsK, partial [Chloroflexi bacterium]|nr:DNA translocase FtsK [Chloroflexota bacterium]
MPAPKNARSNKKSAPPSKAPARPAAKKAPPRKAPARRAQPARQTRAAPSPRRTPRKSPTPPPPPAGMSLDRKLDIAGVVLALAGLLTLLSLLSANQSKLSGGWIALLSRGFGWGVYLLPLALIVVGMWLVLRNFERVPLPSVERLLGVFLFYAWLLTLLHYTLLPADRAAALALASQGQGGGYAGALLLEALRIALGLGGAAVALLAWLLIAVTLSLDISVLDLFRWLPPLQTRLQDALDEWRAGRASTPPQPPPQEDFTPLERANLPAQPPVAAQRQPAINFIPSSQPRPWELPDAADILEAGGEVNYDDDFDRQRAQVIEETLASFGAPARVVEISRGPTITMFGVEPDFIESRGGRMRVRVGKIAALADDLALALSASTIRIQAPVPGKGYVGIEAPNEQIARVALRDVIESEAFRRLKSPLRFALGQDVAGNAVAADLAAMPHLLVAGATGSGKSVCVNALICCLLLHNTPDDLRLIMVDPKRVELTGYNGIPHLLAPVVVELERVTAALQWVLREMDQRYHKLAQAGCRNVKDYNAKLIARGEKKLPHLVVIIDELADLMMLAPEETERSITRLAQLARATGIHLIIATQRPSVDVVTGLIKANFPARVAFAVASGVDSRVILDQPGAERLLGRGDMLFQAPDAAAPVRLQGAFVSDGEIQSLVGYWAAFNGPQPGAVSAAGAPDALPSGVPLKQIPLWEDMQAEEDKDPLLDEAIDLARRQGRASISMLQRRLRIGYTRAARLVETMEAKGIVGPPELGTGTRPILDYGPAAPP